MSRSVSKSLRKEIVKRDLGLCRYCGTMPMIIEIDHVVPYSIGGPTHINNLVTACFDCNREKADATWQPLPIGSTYRPKELPLLGSREPTRERVDRSYKPVGRSDPANKLKRGNSKNKFLPGNTMTKKKLAAKREQNKKCIYCQKLGSDLITGYGFFYHEACKPKGRI